MKNKMVKLLALALATVMTLSVAACGSNNEEPANEVATEGNAENVESTSGVAEDGKTHVKIGWNYAITSLAPYQAESPAKNCLRATAVMESLCQFDENGVLQNVLAKEWKQIDEEGYKFSIEIYDYIHDSAGNHITAEDVKFSIEKVKEGGNLNIIFNKLANITVTSDYTLELEMSQNEYGDIEELLSYSFIVSQKAFEESGDEMSTTLTATGPYKVTDFVNSSSLTVEKVEDYWQTDESLRGPSAVQNVDVIDVVCIPEASQQVIALETGTVDYVHEIPGSAIEELAGYDTITSGTYPGINHYMIYMSSAGPLADERLREAVAYAIDADAVNEAAYEGVFSVGNFALSNLSDYNEAWENEEYYPYDPEKARELMAEAGYDGTTLKLLATGTGVTMAELFQAYLMEVGFNVEFVNLELATYLTDSNNPEAYDLVTISPTGSSNIALWKTVLDARNFENGTTVNGFKDEKLQSLLETAASIEGHTEENMTALYDYAVDKNYIYSPFAMGVVAMWRTDSVIEEVVQGHGVIPVIGGFTYTWN